ncbi:Transcriptional regulatory protein ZraR [Caulifigura coniformis]|uniref:Transcriptional regulatory protein ZraR n=1 Tax=Caulifigura coniformis TaxID=2527983 RepID=A0A517S8Y9_9PLAN|nr:sigma-54 dependent transcriptional regulator [Caulifigura coniformis]QDT52595.1 Transcriptional regulatory protein ZraR [Caulifigura coniformis]
MAEPEPARILIADDEAFYLRTTEALLRQHGYDCVTAPDGETALKALSSQPFDLVLSDLNMPGNRNLELLQEQRAKWPEIPLIVVTGAPSLPTAIESVRLGIADYLLKPVRFQDLRNSIQRALARSRAGHLRTQAALEAIAPAGEFPEIIGRSPAMGEVLGILGKISQSDANVLITGESGTGKEVVARAIHNHGPRAAHAFQVVDCTAIPESLFESVLFGHVKGSFTGAVQDQDGLLSRAHRGTVFFDEIGELPLGLQAKLLRLIQEQTFTPVGKSTPVQFDVRFLSATNRDLELEVNAGRFRRDLFYRLAVIHLELPPLKDREGDVMLLARHFLGQLQPAGERVVNFSPAAAELMRKYSWPGNIRELRNAIERGLALASSELITPEDLPRPVAASGGERPAWNVDSEGGTPSRGQALQEAEIEYLKTILQGNHGNVARAAQQAGMSRQGLHKRLKKAGIDAADYRR